MPHLQAADANEDDNGIDVQEDAEST